MKKGVIMASKWCWIAKEYRKGWRIGLCLGNDDPIYLRVWFADEQEVKKVLKGKIVFVYLANRSK
jgi:hypothetical protein